MAPVPCRTRSWTSRSSRVCASRSHTRRSWRRSRCSRCPDVQVGAKTETRIAASPNPSTVEEPITLRATVGSPVAGAGRPTGVIVFSAGGLELERTTLVAGSAGGSTVGPLSAGTHDLTAAYGGDGQFASSTGSVVQVVVVAGARPATSSPNPSNPEEPVTVTVTVRSAGTGPGVPTGSVVAGEQGTRALGRATLAAGAARIGVGPLSPGAHHLTVGYEGDASFEPGEASVIHRVTLTTVTALTSVRNPSHFGRSTWSRRSSSRSHRLVGHLPVSCPSVRWRPRLGTRRWTPRSRVDHGAAP